MSAIYGAISLTGKSIDSNIANKFHEGYKDCVIDRYDIKSRPDAVMGCELQYFTAEAVNEVLPIIDEEHHIMFTTDCYLDYRAELMNELGITDESIPDGSLLYKAYLKWGRSVMEHARGLFSFVAYHWDTGEILLQTDHFSTRCLFYQIHDNTLYFSTLFFPLIHGTGIKNKHNERWLADALTLRSPCIITEPEETAVLGVNKIVSGQQIVIKGKDVQKITYWDPKQKIPTNKAMTDKECEQKVRALMQKSVEQTIRTQGEVAVLLSSGLDSSTVACLAAPMLDKKNKKLYSYTSVPLKEAGLPEKGYHVYDETKGVQKICAAYPNIEPTFMACEGKNILTEAESIVKEWELPCKSEQNAVWLREIKKAAVKNGCKVMLTGATGNCTISAGSLANCVGYELSKGNIIGAYKGIGIYTRKYRGYRKNFIKSYIRENIRYYTWYFDKDAKNVYKTSITRLDLAERLKVKKRFNKELMHFKPVANTERMRKECYMRDANAQIGEIETKSSLYSGILERDPMRNVDFIEFCMSLPMRCFNTFEYDRRLIREFMHGIVPDEIRLDVQHRGSQSGDNEYRIAQVWDEYLPRIREKLSSAEARRYIDHKQAEEKLRLLKKEEFAKQQVTDMRIMVDAYLFSLYLDYINI